MEEIAIEILSWDFFAMTASQRQGWGAGSRAPTTFVDVQQYVHLFRPLLMEELRAHLLQVQQPCEAVDCAMQSANVPQNEVEYFLQVNM